MNKLRKPYKHVLSIKDALQFRSGLRNVLAAFDAQCQCTLLNKKMLSYGIRLDLFVLAYPTNLTGDGTGISRQDWNRLRGTVISDVRKYLGIEVNSERYSADSKFQINDTFYIAYKELL